MDVSARLTELAKIRGARTPVVSVYLNTRWADEHQTGTGPRLLKNEILRARRAGGLDSDLDWIQAQGESLVTQARFPDAHGVALFACEGLGLRGIIPVAVPFENAFVVADPPFLRPLATALEEAPSTLIVFVDGESARLIPLSAEGAGEEVALQSDVPGRHRRGGWALLAQSRYQRHIQDHRGRHFEAVAEALVQLFGRSGADRHRGGAADGRPLRKAPATGDREANCRAHLRRPSRVGRRDSGARDRSPFPSGRG